MAFRELAILFSSILFLLQLAFSAAPGDHDGRRNCPFRSLRSVTSNRQSFCRRRNETSPLLRRISNDFHPAIFFRFPALVPSSLCPLAGRVLVRPILRLSNLTLERR